MAPLSGMQMQKESLSGQLIAWWGVRNWECAVVQLDVKFSHFTKQASSRRFRIYGTTTHITQSAAMKIAAIALIISPLPTKAFRLKNEEPKGGEKECLGIDSVDDGFVEYLSCHDGHVSDFAYKEARKLRVLNRTGNLCLSGPLLKVGTSPPRVLRPCGSGGFHVDMDDGDNQRT